MSDAQAGTPAVAPENSEAGQAQAADGSGLNAQQQKEYMTLKQKAEDYNKLEAKAKEMEARLAQMERLAVSQGREQATDPVADDIAALREQAAYDPVARATLRSMREAAEAKAEAWLSRQVADVPVAKRAQVEELIRAYGYQINAQDALKLVTDPDSSTSQSRIAELEAENARLKERAAQPHGVSPAAVTPATTSGATTKETMPWSEMSATLKRGGAAAAALREKMDSGAVKPDYTK